MKVRTLMSRMDDLEGLNGGLLGIGACQVEVEGDEEGLTTANLTGYVAEPNKIHPTASQDVYYAGSASDQYFPV